MKTVIDLLCQDPGQLIVWDFKTSSRMYSELETALSLQATIYLNAVWENYKELPIFDFVVLVKTKSPKIQRIPTTRNEQDFGRLGDLPPDRGPGGGSRRFLPRRITFELLDLSFPQAVSVLDQ